eukprot:3941400-Rhodomonas_salina.3
MSVTTLSCYACAMRCAVLTYAMCYAMCGTDIRYMLCDVRYQHALCCYQVRRTLPVPPHQQGTPYAVSGTDITYAATRAVPSGTDLGYAATIVVLTSRMLPPEDREIEPFSRELRRGHAGTNALASYGIATRSPVLSRAMMLRAASPLYPTPSMVQTAFLCTYARARRCPGKSYGRVPGDLRAYDAMSGTELAYDAMRCPSGSELAWLTVLSVVPSASCLRLCYAQCGTELAYGATSLLRAAAPAPHETQLQRLWYHSLAPYALTTPCPILAYCMKLNASASGTVP